MHDIPVENIAAPAEPPRVLLAFGSTLVDRFRDLVAAWRLRRDLDGISERLVHDVGFERDVQHLSWIDMGGGLLAQPVASHNYSKKLPEPQAH